MGFKHVLFSPPTSENWSNWRANAPTDSAREESPPNMSPLPQLWKCIWFPASYLVHCNNVAGPIIYNISPTNSTTVATKIEGYLSYKPQNQHHTWKWMLGESFHFLGRCSVFSRANLPLVSGRLFGESRPWCRWPSSEVLKVVKMKTPQGWLLGDLKWMDVYYIIDMS